MKILFSVGELEKDVNATTKIVIQLAEKLCLLGHSCAVAGVCNAFPENEVVNGVQLVRLPSVSPIVKASESFEKFFTAEGRNRNSARMDFVKKHPVHGLSLFFKYRPEYYKKVEQPRYLKQIKAFAAEFGPDALVCVCKPILPVETVALSDISCPVYFYQVDPWGFHRIDNAENREDIINRELAVFEKAAHIFTTPVLMGQYAQHPGYSRYLYKAEGVEFPNIREYIPQKNVKSAISFDGEYINILFCGILTDQFRSPEYALKAVTQLIDRGEKIRLYFMGVNNSRVLDRYMEKYPENIFFRDRVPAETAFATMEKADVLFNISNTLDNQVPSKIFDYFSMGKAVLNLQKIENCPAREYFDRYPLSFTIEENRETDIHRLSQFLKNSRTRQLEFSEVEEIFRDATVDYVAERMEKAFAENAPQLPPVEL